MPDRGVIVHRDYSTRIKDYSGLLFVGGITPTDIDGLIEYQNKLYIFIEFKHGDSDLPRGQRLALERLCDDLSIQKPCLVIIARYEGSGDIDAANAVVREYRYEEKWHRMSDKSPVSVRDMCDRFINHHAARVLVSFADKSSR